MTLTLEEVMALRHQLEDFNDPQACIPLSEDSQPAIDLLSRPATDDRSKHLDVGDPVIREDVDNGLVKVTEIYTNSSIESNSSSSRSLPAWLTVATLSTPIPTMKRAGVEGAWIERAWIRGCLEREVGDGGTSTDWRS
ncbi:Ribonuclease H-like domain [Teratosphaeria destructans]|uniref:Ribonuclease H-like domain n=1 Tax=Teratosphaeria destructans TaxID=418781 RepID=A0A9W7W2M7_9PEZI|nr:Ribonuclease H-like domain [Teratosphaeria destructans]